MDILRSFVNAHFVPPASFELPRHARLVAGSTAAVALTATVTAQANSISRRGERNEEPALDGRFANAAFACASLATSPSVSSDKGSDGSSSGDRAEQREPKTGLVFPAAIDDEKLLAVGVRSKNLFGLASVKVYAFGVYIDPSSVVRELSSTYGSTSASILSNSKWFQNDVIAKDTKITVRLIISYKRLKIKQIKGAFEESVGNGIEKLSGAPNKPLLNSFTSLFTDDIPLEKGTIIDLRRDSGHTLTASVGGKKLGSIQSQLLCKALFDLYMGDKPFDADAKKVMSKGLAAILTT